MKMKFLFTSLPVQMYQVMRIKKVITKHEMSGYLDKFSFLVPQKIYGEQ